MSKPQWDGRDVEFVEYDIAVGEAVVAAATAAADLPHGDPAKNRAMYIALVASIRYADDGAPVFASVDEARAQPFRLIQRLQRLGMMAVDRNKIEEVEDDSPLDDARADVPSSARAGNGAVRQ